MSADKFLIRVSSPEMGDGDQIEMARYCNVCKQPVQLRFDIPTIDDLSELLDFIKSNPDHFKCSNCGN